MAICHHIGRGGRGGRLFRNGRARLSTSATGIHCSKLGTRIVWQRFVMDRQDQRPHWAGSPYSGITRLLLGQCSNYEAFTQPMLETSRELAAKLLLRASN